MIYTLTTNPAIDLNIICETIKPSLVNRTKGTKYFPNGKGVNVSLVLKHYGVNSTALGFFGGFSGKYIVDELKMLGLKVKPTWIEEPTRINIFVNDGVNEYKFVNKGSLVSKEKQKEFLSLAKSLCDCRYLIISGSLPSGIDVSYYDKILQVCQEKGIEVILDISSQQLKNLLKYRPLLIKPNDEEIKEIFGIEMKTESDIKRTLNDLHNMGAQNILLTLGDKGLYFYDGDKLYFCNAPKVKLLSSACAGDSALGAFLSEWLFSKEIETALKKSSATGANVAESEGLGLLDKVDEYIKELNIREVF
ncbi:MAG TPA: 1-phosphofructokinase [Eubacteriaceae bacterium]|nr:1-phosphofructokinase [Eubacteriaceae bacterium]